MNEKDRNKCTPKKAAGNENRVVTKDTGSYSGLNDLREIKRAMELLPEIRDLKTARVKKVVAEGKYTIDPLKIAEKMISEI